MSSNRLKIEWLTKSLAMKAYFDGDRTMQYTGGTLYEIDAIETLSENYDISVNLNYIKTENTLKYYFKRHQKFLNADICVTDPYVLAFNKLDYKRHNIAIIHHIDEGLVKQTKFGKFFLKQLLKNLAKVDLVVVVSKYWKNYLASKGIENIKIIYNSYNLEDFEVEEYKLETLKKKLQLDSEKPTIYLGKLGKGKGVEKVLQYIDVSKYNLIATGKNKSTSDAYRTVFLPKEDFPVLLKLADVVLCMSTMPEGWNRIAHEAMLVKTPVIGSGSGGMKELLNNAGQSVISEFSKLESEIQKVIENKIELGDLAFDYVKQFNSEYFKSEWTSLIRNVIQEGDK